MSAVRKVIEVINATPASDGDGVKLLRVFGGRGPERFDPFLMLDEFGSNEASDYIGGFPPHPHRGFETVTYMLQGKMEHRDHMGNVGLLKDGDVQWMSAAGGVIHSEMPKQTEGKMRGFQLWVNLPAKEKMRPASYSDVAAEDIPIYAVGKNRIKAIAGQMTIGEQDIVGKFTDVATQPVYFDVHLQPGEQLRFPVDKQATVLLYSYDGDLSLGDAKTGLAAQQLARLTDGDEVVVTNPAGSEARFLIMAARPLGEPIVQYGPFVMNTHAEIEQALSDYRLGKLVQAG